MTTRTLMRMTWSKKFLVLAVAVCVISASVFLGQVLPAPSKPSLSFEVASIRPAGPFDLQAFRSGKMHLGMSVYGDRVDISTASLKELVCWAYHVHCSQVIGGPAWLDSERFGVQAKIPDGATKEKVPEMLQALLEQRFKLVAHREKRDISAYALIVRKGGPNFKEAVPDPPRPASTAEESTSPRGTESTSGVASSQAAPGKPSRVKLEKNGKVRDEYDSITMERFAAILSAGQDRPVVDQTELKGNYQISYEIDLMVKVNKVSKDFELAHGLASNPAGPADAASDPRDSGDYIFSSLRQLGLKLDPRKLPYDVIIIDHIEKTPTEN